MIRNIASIILVIVWMSVIFLFSSNDGISSSEKSNRIARFAIEVLNDINPSITEKDNFEEKLSFIIRKIAHFTEYFILGILLMNVMFILGIGDIRIPLACIIVILYACSDELHQVLVDGRNGNIADTLLDSSAGLFAIWLYYKFIILRFSYEEVND